MKKIVLVCVLVASVGTFFGQSNTSLTTLRIGDFKIYTPIDDVSEIVGIPFNYDEEEGYVEKKVKYNGDSFELTFSSHYEESDETTKMVLYGVTTTSKKYRTKSGIGVGSTRDELIETYKNFPRFEVYPEWDDDKPSKTTFYFALNDYDAVTYLAFKLVNNVVVSISIYVDYGEC